MDKLHRDQSLVLQLTIRALIRNENRRKHLDGELLVVKLCVIREPDRPHPTLPKLFDNAIAICEECSLAPWHSYGVVYGIVRHSSHS